jgi:hypothetical protein
MKYANTVDAPVEIYKRMADISLRMSIPATCMHFNTFRENLTNLSVARCFHYSTSHARSYFKERVHFGFNYIQSLVCARVFIRKPELIAGFLRFRILVKSSLVTGYGIEYVIKSVAFSYN